MTKQDNLNELPPKSSTIDQLITKEEAIKKVISGSKTATRRNRRHADVGEIMTLHGHEFIIENVYEQKLGEVTESQAKQEGYQDLEQYKDSILSLHPGMKWVPAMKVWVHEFKAVKE